MPYSKYDRELSFDENEWVVTLINTKKGLLSVLGGHAKIVVEGLIKKNSAQFPELFLGEYHIMEAEGMSEETWIPQCLRNTKGNYVVLFLEENQYKRSDTDYAETASRSHGGIPAKDVMKMIHAIKQEHRAINQGDIAPDFQYAGVWCAYGMDGAHNCTTWAEEKLGIIGLEKHLVTDSSKALSFLHVNAPDSVPESRGCVLF